MDIASAQPAARLNRIRFIYELLTDFEGLAVELLCLVRVALGIRDVAELVIYDREVRADVDGVRLSSEFFAHLQTAFEIAPRFCSVALLEEDAP